MQRVSCSRDSIIFRDSFESLETLVAHDAEAVFEDLFEQHYEEIVYWFLRRGVEREQAKELTQETFLSAFKGLDTFREEASHKTWLFRIARNVFKNHLRDKSTLKRSGHEIPLGTGDSSDPDEDGISEIEDTATAPIDEQLIHQERYRIVQGSLNTLPDRMRQCLLLRQRGFKYQEIAAVMDLSIETVKSHLHQGRLRLREQVERGETNRDTDD